MQEFPQHVKGAAVWEWPPLKFYVEGNNLPEMMNTFVNNNVGKLTKDPALYFVKMREWFHAMGYDSATVTVDRKTVWYLKPLIWLWIKWARLIYMNEGDSAFDK